MIVFISNCMKRSEGGEIYKKKKRKKKRSQATCIIGGFLIISFNFSQDSTCLFTRFFLPFFFSVTTLLPPRVAMGCVGSRVSIDSFF